MTKKCECGERSGNRIPALCWVLAGVVAFAAAFRGRFFDAIWGRHSDEPSPAPEPNA